MTPASKSLYYFGFYLLVTGFTLVVAPNFLLGLFQIQPTTEIWIRALGAVVVGIAIYYIFMAPANSNLFLMLSVYTRFSILIWFTAFVMMDIAPFPLIFFGLVDAAGATWTYLLLKKS